MIGLKPVQMQEQQTLLDLLVAGLVKDRSVAIDGGAHAGGWTAIMAREFEQVLAFEPAESFDLLELNTASLPNVVRYQAALMDKPGRVRVVAPRKTLTARQVEPDVAGNVPAMTVDGLNLPRLGLLKLDLEGCEFLALRGALKTLERCRPFVLVEIGRLGKRFGHSPRDVDALLKAFGYQACFESRQDRGYKC